ncbi:MAG: hypothetical protein MRZ61_05515 [Oscillospiraceae bacterium]|nr:hypothetical protein [Oscillospiraceae bacterium]
MKLEIDMLTKSIEFYSSHKQEEITGDIYGMSVSHPAENSGGSNPNVSADKIPGIAERIDRMYSDYDTELSKLKYKHNVFSYTVSGIDSFLNFLPKEQAKIIRRLYIDKERKTFGEISAEINLSERRIKQIVNGILLRYYETSNYDLDIILELLQ